MDISSIEQHLTNMSIYIATPDIVEHRQIRRQRFHEISCYGIANG